MTRLARAKLNLYLHVLGRRPDGYHELDSLIAFTELGDRLSFAPARDVTLTVSGEFAELLGPAEDNLVIKAARLLRGRFEVRAGAAIHIEKRLPVAAGLGGGSADAAAALYGLSELWGLQPSPVHLAGLALELGTDVAVCLARSAMYVGGIGDRPETARGLPEAGIVLVNPRVPLPTPSVYGAFAGPYSAPARWSEPPADAAELAERLAARRNDLTRPALGLCPVIGEVLAGLGASPGVLLARMSGSGATCFGLCGDEADAAKAAERLRLARPGWWVAATRLA